MPSTGIYKIENKINGYVYIGQSVNIENRWREHKRGKQSPNMVISRAIKKYGSSNFMFDIVELCDKNELNTKEIYWISVYDSYKKGYNSTTGGDAPTDKSSNKLSSEQVKDIKQKLIDNILTIKSIAKEYSVADTTITSINTGASWYDSCIQYPLRSGVSAYWNNLREINKAVQKEKKTKSMRPKMSKGTYKKDYGNCPYCNKVLQRKAKTCKNCKNISQYKCIHPSRIELIAGVLNSNQTALGLKYGVSGNSIKKWCKKYNIPVTKKGFKFNWSINNGVGKGNRILINNV